MSAATGPTRLAVVTGAGVRVGRAVALGLARDGCDVVVHVNKSIDAARSVVKEIEALGQRAFLETADLADDAAVDGLADRIAGAHGVVDVLVHSAAGFEKVAFGEIDRAQYRKMQRVNLEAPFFLTQRLLRCLERAADPCVVHVVDVAADRPMNGYAHYSVSKAGIGMLTRALAVELAPKIRVNGVAPGTVAFPESFSTEDRARLVRRIPLGREGSPDDVAAAVVFLTRAKYLTGAVIPVDGGRGVVL